MSKFKVGDMVRTPGEPGTIIAILGDSVSPLYTVRNHLGVEWHWTEHAIEPQSWPERPPVEPNAETMQMLRTMGPEAYEVPGRTEFDDLKADNARLHKELEAANARQEDWEKRLNAEKEHNAFRDDNPTWQAENARLRAFSEDQARQIQKLEEEVSQWRDGFQTARADQNAANADVGRLTRELDKLKRSR